MISHASDTMQSGGSIAPVRFLPKMDKLDLNIYKPKVREKLSSSHQKHQGRERRQKLSQMQCWVEPRTAKRR